MDILKIMKNLQLQRKVFFSEKDFQFALAWEIQKFNKKANIRLEYCPFPKMNVHIDIIVELDNKYYLIELKYKTKKIEITDNNDRYFLKTQSATDIGRFDYLKDIQRIEQFSKEIPRFECGYAILLTNDNLYWKKEKTGTIDEQFYLSRNTIKTGTLSWGVNASNGTTKNRTIPIELLGKYKIVWNDYSIFRNIINGEFRYCMNKIKNYSSGKH